MISTKNSNIPDEEIFECLKRERIGIEFITDFNLEYDPKPPVTSRSSELIVNKTSNLYCFCKKGKDKDLKGFCPYCGNGIYHQITEIPTKDAVTAYNTQRAAYQKAIEDYDREKGCHHYIGWHRGYNDKKVKIYDKFFVTKHPDYPYGIIIKKIIIHAQPKGKDLNLVAKMDKFIEIIPGERCEAYNVKKTGNEKMDLFTAFNLSSNTAKYDVPIDWQGADNMLDFLALNNDFAKRTGFKEVFNNDVGELYKNSFFMLYMYAYSEYPVIEMLAKMGYTKIIAEALRNVSKSYNKENMKKRADELTKVFNPYGTTGKLSLTIPKYIGDYLKDVGASYHDFENWSDIYSYEKISKENFEKFVLSDDYAKTYDSFNAISNLMKYGYTLFKLMSYITKQMDVLKCSVRDVVTLIKDYQITMELLGVEPDMYPANIRDVHDKAVLSYHMAKNKLNDEKIKRLSEIAKKYIPESERYTIVLPENTIDFITEGERQHNCVATYVKSVIENRCYIFFVRLKEDPTRNYITAEYRRNSLYQIKEKNNHTVTNKEAIDFAKKFCDKLSKDTTFRTV